MKEYRKFFKDLSLALLALLMVSSPILYFNIIVDPYCVFFNKPKNISFEPNNRYLKMNYLIKNPDKFNSFIFGSSRVNFLNPDNIADVPYFNMTYSMGLPKNHSKDIETLIQNGTKIKNLLIGIDYLSLLENPDITDNDLLRKDYPISLLENIQFFFSYIFYRPSWDLVDFSTTIDNNVDRSQTLISGIVTNRNIDSIIDTDPLKHIKQERFHIPSSAFITNSNIDDAIGEIEKIIQIAKTNHINYSLFINPTHHYTYLNLNFDKYIYALRKLAEITDYYDFSGLNSIAIDNLKYLETSHFREEVGDLIIARLLNHEGTAIPEDFGCKTNLENVEDQISLHKSLILDYFKSTRLQNHYESPVDLQELTKKDGFVGYSIGKINELKFDNCKSPMLITTPWIKIQALAMNENVNDSLDVLIKIGNRFFNTVDFLNKNEVQRLTGNLTSQKPILDLLIPTCLLENGIQELAFVILSPDRLSYSIKKEVTCLNILNSDNVIESDKLVKHDQPAQFYVDKINGIKSNEFTNLSDTSFISMFGWAIDPLSDSSSGGLIVTLDGKEYLSQFTMGRHDLSQHFNNPKIRFAGWGITIPCFNMTSGQHEITFKVLDKESSGYFPVKRRIHFYYQNDHLDDLLSNLSKSEGKTAFSIDKVNGIIVAKTTSPIIINESTIKITGWAIDLPEKGTASKVIVEIGGRYYDADYGTDRPDVAKFYQDEKLKSCGWNINIPTKNIGKGEFILTFKIISKNGMSFFDVSKEIAIKII